MHRHIYEMNLAWGQMLDFYTDLNNARKEKDDKYAEDTHIGEEIIEPDENHQIPFATEKRRASDDDDTGNLLSALKEEIQKEEESKLSEDYALIQPTKIAIKTAVIEEH